MTAMWLTLVSSPSTGQADILWPKAPILNHIVSIESLAWPKIARYTRTPYQAGHSKGLEVTPSRSWAKADLSLCAMTPYCPEV